MFGDSGQQRLWCGRRQSGGNISESGPNGWAAEAFRAAPGAERRHRRCHGTVPRTADSLRSKYRRWSSWGTASRSPRTLSSSRCTCRCTLMTPGADCPPVAGPQRWSRRLRLSDHASQQPSKKEVQLHIDRPSSNSPSEPPATMPSDRSRSEDTSSDLGRHPAPVVGSRIGRPRLAIAHGISAPCEEADRPAPDTKLARSLRRRRIPSPPCGERETIRLARSSHGAPFRYRGSALAKHATLGARREESHNVPSP